MNPTTAHDPSHDLQRAFLSFERAAEQLTVSQDRLLERVRVLEAELKAVLDAADTGIAVIDSAADLRRTNATFDAWNLAAEGFATVLHTPLAAWIAAGAGAPLRRDFRVGPRDLAATCVAVGERCSSFVLTLKDVTSIRREAAEGSRRRRLEALGRMAAELAHEVRNPLGSMRLFAGLLHEDLHALPEQRRMVEQILAGVAGLEATVSNLLSFAAERPLRTRSIDLARQVRETCEWIAPACSARGVRLHGPRPDECTLVRGDAEALRQIVLNLLSNALAATGDGGSVRAEVVLGRADGVELHVEDDGHGIAPEDLPRVFDPFFSRTEGGTGLGLSIVHQLVESHGGTIEIDSEQGRGTRVRIVLPPAEDLG